MGGMNNSHLCVIQHAQWPTAVADTFSSEYETAKWRLPLQKTVSSAYLSPKTPVKSSLTNSNQSSETFTLTLNLFPSPVMLRTASLLSMSRRVHCVHIRVRERSTFAAKVVPPDR